MMVQFCGFQLRSWVNRFRRLVRATFKMWKYLAMPRTYYLSLLFNFGAFLLPALYATLSKLWVANIDKTQVVTIDVYTHIQTIVEVLNEGLPRVAWTIIGDKSTRTVHSRISLAYTMIVFQASAGLMITMIVAIFAQQFADVFVPAEIRATSINYVRISSVSALSSSLEIATAACSRSLDKPTVPMLISCVKFVINMTLDFMFLSKFQFIAVQPSATLQALIRMICELSAALFGLIYFLYIVTHLHPTNAENKKPWPSFNCLKVLSRPALYTFVESAIRNSIYLWLVSGIVKMGSDYATAWGVFMTIRWGLVMCPVLALEASSLTFVGHRFGEWRFQVGSFIEKPTASNKDLLRIAQPALFSAVVGFSIEAIFCIFMGLFGAENFAYFLSNSEVVAQITRKMWNAIDWTYVIFSVNVAFGTILLATIPRLFFYQALTTNLLWMLPWSILVTQVHMTEQTAWFWHSIIFGGAFLINFGSVTIVLALWVFWLKKGSISLPAISEET